MKKKFFIFLMVLFLAHVLYKVLYNLNHQKMNKFHTYIFLRSVFILWKKKWKN